MSFRNPIGNGFGNERGQATMALVLVTSAVLMIGGTVALSVTGNDIKASGHYHQSVSAMYVAEAGIEHGKVLFSGMSAEDLAMAFADTDETTLVSAQPFSNGTYSVALRALGPVAGGGERDDLFEVDDGAINAKRSLDVTFKALGSAITYGAGGPEIDVFCWASLDGGITWIELFGGQEIDGGEAQVEKGVGEDAEILLKVNGRYHNKFNSTYRSDCRCGRLLLLRDGDEVPDYDPFDDQANVEEFLAPIIGANKKISVGENDVVMLAELGSLSGATADFQDAVVLVQMSDPGSEAQQASSEGSESRFAIVSTGTLRSGASHTVELVLASGGGSGGVAPTLGVEAALTADCPVGTQGRLQIDGRDHDLDGNRVGGGVKAINTTSYYIRKGNSKVGGVADGTTYAPSRNKRVYPNVVDEGVSRENMRNPDQVLGLPQGALKALAQTGANGSQYVTNPRDLSLPLSGVTYVELEKGVTWKPVHLKESGGILVVHNDQGSAYMKNINTGSFTGLVIADDITHLHTDILGAVYVLTDQPFIGNCMGNGKGTIRYSSQAVSAALAEATVSGGSGGVRAVSWREL